MQDPVQLMSDEDIVKEYKGLDYTIYDAQSYGISDMLRIQNLLDEIEKRGINLYEYR
jgi:hypothetical protein